MVILEPPSWNMLPNILGLFALIGAANADLQPFYQSAGYDMSQYGAWPLQSYLSSRISGPILNYWNRSEACEKESYTLIAPRGDSVRHTGPMILDQNGNLVWFQEYPTTYNFNIQSFRGEDYLTFWAGNDGIGGHGDGILYMVCGGCCFSIASSDNLSSTRDMKRCTRFAV